MAEAVGIAAGRSRPGTERRPVLLIRIATLAVLLVLWEVTARSGLLYQDVVPTLGAIAGGIAEILGNPQFYGHLQITVMEIAAALLIGGLLGVVAGIVIGVNPFVGKVFEPLVYYLGPTPKIIFFPLLIMWFGIGEPSKIAMGTISTFFPVTLSVAAGIRQIDPILIRVGRGFRANALQMALKIYFPAMREPFINGLRLAFGVSVIGVLLAETKFAHSGLGYMVTQFYQQFDMPAMYGLVIIIFGFAITVNWVLGRFSHAGRP